MKYNGGLNKLLLNVQKNMAKKTTNNATVDKRHYQRTSEIKRETTAIEMVIKSCAKDILGLDTKRSC